MTWMGRRPETTSTTNVEYSACSCEEWNTSSGDTPFVRAHSAMLGTTFIVGADGGGVSSTRAGAEDVDGRGGKDLILSAVGWEDGTRSSTIRAMMGVSSSDESPERMLAVLYSFRRGQEVERAVWPFPVLPARLQLMHDGLHVHVREPSWGVPAQRVAWLRALWAPPQRGQIMVPLQTEHRVMEWSRAWQRSQPWRMGRAVNFSTVVAPPKREGRLQMS